jgi:hypothetical protein
MSNYLPNEKNLRKNTERIKLDLLENSQVPHFDFL